MIGFYIIRNNKTGKYLSNKYRKEADADLNTECRLVSEANAQTVIRDLQARGANVANLEVVPVEITPLKPIAANIRKTKPGYYIRFTHPKGEYSYGVLYWKGNKKAPTADFGHISRGPKSPETASRFNTRDEADNAYHLVVEGLKADRKKFVTDPIWRRDRATYIKIIDGVKIDIVEEAA